MVTDQQIWEHALSGAAKMYESLPAVTRKELDNLIDSIIQLKQGLVEQVTSIGGSDLCRVCGGECCLLGKYHVTVLDILAFRKTATEPVQPNFRSRPACPYSCPTGCAMPPGYRPVTCVIFNCDQIDEQLTKRQQETMQRHETQLRDAVAKASAICGKRLDRPLLLNSNDSEYGCN